MKAMSLLERENRVWNFVSFNSNRGIVGLGLIEAYIDFKKVPSVEELKPLLPLMPNEVAAAYKRLADEFFLRSRKLTVTESGFRDLETLDAYKKTPYKGRSLKEALELLIAEAQKNNIKLPKVLKNTIGYKKPDGLLNKKPDLTEEYLPTKEDCERAIEKLKHSKTTNKISDEAVLHFLESDFKNKGVALKNKWRLITKENFKIWFK